jgi:hypothetical protein
MNLIGKIAKRDDVLDLSYDYLQETLKSRRKDIDKLLTMDK